MTRVFVISDLHFGHTKIMEFSKGYREGNTYLENMDIICKKWNNRVRKRDKVFVNGDICFDISLMPVFDELNGTKILIRGNHDRFDTEEYLKYFKEVHGLYKYSCKGFSAWLSHCPIHPQELRDKINIHGHVHQNHILLENGERDPRYFNACIENSDGAPTPMEWIKSGNYSGREQWRELRNDIHSMKGIKLKRPKYSSMDEHPLTVLRKSEGLEPLDPIKILSSMKITKVKGDGTD